MLIVGPIVAIVGLLAMVVVGIAFTIPLVPFALLALFVWLLVRAASRPAVA
jgi:hypothetical protein